MRTKVQLLIFLLIPINIFGQSEKSRYIGLNLLQLPALTIDANYSTETKPFLTATIDLGYTFNYSKAINIDWIGYVLTPHCKCANNGYELNKQSGGYLKLGGFFNLRKDFEKQSFFHFGLFLTNSIVYESGEYQPLNENGPFPEPEPINHTKYIIGLSTTLGYDFSITKRLKSNIDFQISLPNKNYQNLFGYRNNIPGMGFKDYEGYWFPMLIWNIKYRL